MQRLLSSRLCWEQLYRRWLHALTNSFDWWYLWVMPSLYISRFIWQSLLELNLLAWWNTQRRRHLQEVLSKLPRSKRYFLCNWLMCWRSSYWRGWLMRLKVSIVLILLFKWRPLCFRRMLKCLINFDRDWNLLRLSFLLISWPIKQRVYLRRLWSGFRNFAYWWHLFEDYRINSLGSTKILRFYKVLIDLRLKQKAWAYLQRI